MANRCLENFGTSSLNGVQKCRKGFFVLSPDLTEFLWEAWLKWYLLFKTRYALDRNTTLLIPVLSLSDGLTEFQDHSIARSTRFLTRSAHLFQPTCFARLSWSRDFATEARHRFVQRWRVWVRVKDDSFLADFSLRVSSLCTNQVFGMLILLYLPSKCRLSINQLPFARLIDSESFLCLTWSFFFLSFLGFASNREWRRKTRWCLAMTSKDTKEFCRGSTAMTPLIARHVYENCNQLVDWQS